MPKITREIEKTDLQEEVAMSKVNTTPKGASFKAEFYKHPYQEIPSNSTPTYSTRSYMKILKILASQKHL